MSQDLTTLLNPNSIAIIGVSHEPQKVGHIVAKNIMDQGYKGELYFINPHLDRVLNKTVYKSIVDIDAPIDLVIHAVPSEIALNSLQEISQLGIKNVVIYAAGFRETGDDGKKREELLIAKAKEYDLCILGPNCLGFINTSRHINATFLKHSSPKGNISVVSQSGALGSVMIDHFIDHNHLGFSYFISLGNKTVVDESDCLEFLSQDSSTEVIGMYLEDVKDGSRFRETLAKVTKLKPVVILKSGRTQEGSKAALSHTGGLGGDAEVYETIFKQAGAVVANSYQQFIDILKVYSFGKIPTFRSVLVLSNAGGVGVLLTDELVHNHLSLVTITEHTKKELEKSLGSKGFKRITIHNPIDLLGDASVFDYRQAILSSIQQQDIGAVIVLLTPQANTQIMETARAIIEAQNHFIKPIYPVFMGEHSIKDAHRLFEEHHVVSFDSYEPLPSMINAIVESYEYRPKQPPSSHSPETLITLAHEQQIKDILELASSKKFLNLEESMNILHLAGIPLLPIHHVHHKEELDYVIKKLRFPVVAKVASDKITHKTDVKGVVTNIETVQDLKKAFNDLSKIANSEGCYIQKNVKGNELFIGVKRDNVFGPILVYGLGGIYVELLKEVTQFVYPFTLKEFTKKLETTKVIKIIKGFRGAPAIKPQQLYEIGMTLGFLMHHFSDIQAIDINPLFSTDKGLFAADCRLILG